jgi:hypothetical protein
MLQRIPRVVERRRESGPGMTYGTKRAPLSKEQHAPNGHERHHSQGHSESFRHISSLAKKDDDSRRQGRVHSRDDGWRIDQEVQPQARLGGVLGSSSRSSTAPGTVSSCSASTRGSNSLIFRSRSCSSSERRSRTRRLHARSLAEPSLDGWASGRNFTAAKTSRSQRAKKTTIPAAHISERVTTSRPARSRRGCRPHPSRDRRRVTSRSTRFGVG